MATIARTPTAHVPRAPLLVPVVHLAPLSTLVFGFIDYRPPWLLKQDTDETSASFQGAWLPGGQCAAHGALQAGHELT